MASFSGSIARKGRALALAASTMAAVTSLALAGDFTQDQCKSISAITGWDAGVIDGASLASCQQGCFVAFACIDRQLYLVTAGPVRPTQIRFYSRDGRDRSSLDETLSPWDEAGFAVSTLSAETFSYFMDGMAARLTMRDRSIYVDLAGIKRAASHSLAVCMTD